MAEIIEFAPRYKRVFRFAAEDDPEDTFIYVIRASKIGLVKVGISRDPHRRLTGLQQANGTALVLAHVTNPFPSHEARQIEERIHQKLGAHYARHEWFSCSVYDVLKAIILVGAEIKRETRVQR